jgi:carbamoyltransferase
MYILGIHDGHNAAAVLLKDGRIIAGVQEERPRGIKNAMGMPKVAIQDVLAQAGITPQNVDWVALSGLHGGEYLNTENISNPSELILKWHRAKYNQKPINPRRVIRSLVPNNLYELIKGNNVRDRRLDLVASLGFKRDRIQLVEHHTAHAASAYYGWGKREEPILILTNDGMGDNLCATISIGRNGRFERIASVPYTESVAEIYALTTFLMGMVPLEHEYKLMGMAPYASPRGSEKTYRSLAELFAFDNRNGLTWRRSNGMPPTLIAYRYLEKLFHLQRFDQVCGGLQKFVEEFLKTWVGNAIRETGIRKVALSGGIFMNVKANKLLLELDEVEDMFVFPSCGDETNAVGAAYWVYAEECRASGHNVDIAPLTDLYWGRSISDQEIEGAIAQYKFSGKVKVETPANIEKRVAELLAKGEIVARAAGRMEFGARALGNRSILANPSDPSVIKVINEMIKKRDFWMPFAPSMTSETAGRYIRKPKSVPAPYMIFCFDTVPEKVPVFAAGVHPYDGTARPQEVLCDHNPSYYKLIKYFGDITGEEVILNTSFNIHGFPIAYNPKDSLYVFENSGLRYLSIGSFLLTKKD